MTKTAEQPVSELQQLLTVKQVSEMLFVHRNTVTKLIKAGVLPAIKVRGAVRVHKAGLEAYISQQAI